MKETYTMERLAKLYIAEVVWLHGIPLSIISYRDTIFTSTFWQSFQRELGITAYHPQTDGQSERTIKISEDMLRACALNFTGSWEDHLPLIEFAYNNSLCLKLHGIMCLIILQDVNEAFPHVEIDAQAEVFTTTRGGKVVVGPPMPQTNQIPTLQVVELEGVRKLPEMLEIDPPAMNPTNGPSSRLELRIPEHPNENPNFLRLVVGVDYDGEREIFGFCGWSE
ncbi:hypothetical protein OSB04_024586 [Centaurea solstitialis]|uniref:Integrase catalytic domain-containing protein n=1 Tax=Centaurea solstitialis TaxID=347529 RepID=A0AA38WC79_9ASTR|nr:hypothetical protein OSB04_024586 [Centaurea solstitialis]